jgi:hypothetical protein
LYATIFFEQRLLKSWAQICKRFSSVEYTFVRNAYFTILENNEFQRLRYKSRLDGFLIARQWKIIALHTKHATHPMLTAGWELASTISKGLFGTASCNCVGRSTLFELSEEEASKNKLCMQKAIFGGIMKPSRAFRCHRSRQRNLTNYRDIVKSKFPVPDIKKTDLSSAEALKIRAIREGRHPGRCDGNDAKEKRFHRDIA